MIPSDFRGAARTISDAGAWLDAAEALDCDVAAIRAVAEVESRGAAFLASGRPPILFERHVFHRLTDGRWSSTYPAISNPAAGGYGAAGDAQYARLRAAMDLDRAAALEAASWGRWQVMGFNARLCGWASVEAFVAAMCAGEAQQLDAFVGYVRGAGLSGALRRHDWAAFARGYNGPGYAANRYDAKMRAAYAALRSEPGAPAMAGGIVGDVDTVREAQLVLQRLGDEPGPADGIAGPMTRGALERFVARCADTRLAPEINRETCIALQAAWAAMGVA